MCEIDWIVVASFSKVMLTPIIAVLSVYIAYQQWRTNERKLSLDLYDRRLKVYVEVKQIITILIQGVNTSNFDDLIMFRRAVSEADFLFGPEIQKYIEEIYKHGVQFQSLEKQFQAAVQPYPKGYDHKIVCEDLKIERLWIVNQLEIAKEKFKCYLKIHNIYRSWYLPNVFRRG
jgi:hypothetical protein